MRAFHEGGRGAVIRIRSAEGFPGIETSRAPWLEAALQAAPRSVQPGWLHALIRAYPAFRLETLVLEEAGVVTGLLPLVERRWRGLREIMSLPFGTYGGPLLAGGAAGEGSGKGTRDGARALFREFGRRTRGWRVFRFEMTILDPPAGLPIETPARLDERRVSAQTLFIDLRPGKEALWNGYEGRARTSVRKAVKSGVTVAEETGEEALNTLHAMHAAQALARAITWHHHRRALGVVVEALGSDARIWVARKDGRPLCGALALYDRGREATPWVTGAFPESRPLNAFHHLMHAIMEDAIERGVAWWNFGASADSAEVENFKVAFGATPRPLLRFFYEASWVRRARKLTQP